MPTVTRRPARAVRRTGSAILFAALLLASVFTPAVQAPADANGAPVVVLPDGAIAIADYVGDFSCCLSGEVSYNPVSKRTIAVWVAKDDTIMAALVGPGPTVGTPVPVSVEQAATGWFSGHPATVVPTPSGGWLVIYEDRDRQGFQEYVTPLYGQFLDKDGARVGTNLTLSDNYTAKGDSDRRMISYMASWSEPDRRYLLTWSAKITSVNTDTYTALPAGAKDSMQVMGRFLDASGVGIGDDFPITQQDGGVTRFQDSARGSDRWVVVGATASGGAIMAQVVDATGPVGSVQDVSGGDGYFTPSITYNSAADEFLVVFRRNSGSALMVRRLDGDGTPLGAGPVEIEGAPPAVQARVTSMEAGGYLLSLHTTGSADIVLFRIDAAGVRVGDFETVVSNESDDDGTHLKANFRPSVTYDPVAGAAVSWWGITNDVDDNSQARTSLYLRFAAIGGGGGDGGGDGDGSSAGASASTSWVPTSSGAPLVPSGRGEWQRSDGSVTPLALTALAGGRIRYAADGLQVTFTAGAGSNTSRGLVADPDGSIVCEVCTALTEGQVIEAWMFSTPRLAAAHAIDGLACQTFVVPLGAPLDGGAPISAGAHTLQLALPTASGMQAVNVGVTVGGPVPASVPAGEGPTVPVGLLALTMLAAVGAVVAARRLVVAG
jgi:hypothetical protein